MLKLAWGRPLLDPRSPPACRLPACVLAARLRAGCPTGRWRHLRVTSSRDMSCMMGTARAPAASTNLT
jgi:hypothetical protein